MSCWKPLLGHTEGTSPSVPGVSPHGAGPQEVGDVRDTHGRSSEKGTQPLEGSQTQ